MVRDLFDTIGSILKPLMLVIGVFVGFGLASGDATATRASQILGVTGDLFSCNSSVGRVACAAAPTNWFK
ncbi:hypothetical protein DDZ14_10280 [Maritimibacter sp. 55A14]|uniref:hypothetical protein n=1 Tax=Maritimibacter sp. 55A14 TaxID=2174844 RepID=UPI000D60B701|nr:hypothetical protein [Maritimibacter sp. 55A14]PWE32441.1 hypothetical protein DDZ14_10280 [Maritimibacter sp. 55A14]